MLKGITETRVLPSIAEVLSSSSKNQALLGLAQRHQPPSIFGSSRIQDPMRVAPLNIRQHPSNARLRSPASQVNQPAQADVVGIMTSLVAALKARDMTLAPEVTPQQNKLEQEILALLPSDASLGANRRPSQTPPQGPVEHPQTSSAPPIPPKNPRRAALQRESDQRSRAALTTPPPLEKHPGISSPVRTYENPRPAPRPPERASPPERTSMAARLINKLAPPVTHKLHKDPPAPKPAGTESIASRLLDKLAPPVTRRLHKDPPAPKPAAEKGTASRLPDNLAPPAAPTSTENSPLGHGLPESPPPPLTRRPTNASARSNLGSGSGLEAGSRPGPDSAPPPTRRSTESPPLEGDLFDRQSFTFARSGTGGSAWSSSSSESGSAPQRTQLFGLFSPNLRARLRELQKEKPPA